MVFNIHKQNIAACRCDAAPGYNILAAFPKPLKKGASPGNDDGNDAAGALVNIKVMHKPEPFGIGNGNDLKPFKPY